MPDRDSAHGSDSVPGNAPSDAGADSAQDATSTLLGVPMPRVESALDSPQRRPVFVRSGTAPAEQDGEPAPVPRMALPSRPPPADEMPKPLVASGAGSSLPSPGGDGLGSWLASLLRLPVRILGGELPLWMVLAAALVVGGGLLLAVLVVLAGSGPIDARAPVATSSAKTLVAPAQKASAAATAPRASLLQELEGKAPDSMSASELLALAEARAEREREAAKALRRRVSANASLGSDRAIVAELLRFAQNAETARDALSAMAALDGPAGPDLLYEVWTGTAARTDATELARALLYSKDVRPKASPALDVALQLRVAETCEQYEAALPRVLKDGDRRVVHLLTKLNSKRGCGPKKNQDCFACLRDQGDELTATVNAAKSRRPPSFGNR